MSDSLQGKAVFAHELDCFDHKASAIAIRKLGGKVASTVGEANVIIYGSLGWGGDGGRELKSLQDSCLKNGRALWAEGDLHAALGETETLDQPLFPVYWQSRAHDGDWNVGSAALDPRKRFSGTPKVSAKLKKQFDALLEAAVATDPSIFSDFDSPFEYFQFEMADAGIDAISRLYVDAVITTSSTAPKTARTLLQYFAQSLWSVPGGVRHFDERTDLFQEPKLSKIILEILQGGDFWESSVGWILARSIECPGSVLARLATSEFMFEELWDGTQLAVARHPNTNTKTFQQLIETDGHPALYYEILTNPKASRAVKQRVLELIPEAVESDTYIGSFIARGTRNSKLIKVLADMDSHEIRRELLLNAHTTEAVRSELGEK